MHFVAHCIDTGPTEGFCGSLMRERYYGKRFTSKLTQIQTINTYILYYNTRLVQRHLRAFAPFEKHGLYLAAKKADSSSKLLSEKNCIFLTVLLTGCGSYRSPPFGFIKYHLIFPHFCAVHKPERLTSKNGKFFDKFNNAS